MACGALGGEGHWIVPKRAERFLFPVHALSRVFAGKIRAALRATLWPRAGRPLTAARPQTP